MPITTRSTRRINLRHPIVSAPGRSFSDARLVTA